MQETQEIQVLSLGVEDPLEDNPFQYSCQEIPRTEDAGGLQSMELQISDTAEHMMDWRRNFPVTLTDVPMYFILFYFFCRCSYVF